jgi:hypothetical protein
LRGEKMNKFLAVLMVCLVASSVQAIVITPDSLTWENKYECDVTPNLAGWTAAGGFESSFTSASGGILSMNSLAGPGNWFGWYDIASNVSFATGATIEFRARVNAVTTNDNYQGATIRLYDSSGNVANIGFGQAGTAQYAWSNSPGGGIGAVFGDWHTYRITALASEGIKWYIDNNPTAVHSGTSIANWGGTTVEIGDLTGGSDSNWDIDYIRWTGAGAFATPEPASMCLVLAGLLFARKRK